MSSQVPEPNTKELLRLCGGNADAVRLIEGLWLLARLYDQAVDREHKLTADEVHRAMAFALFGLPHNPVWTANPQLQESLIDSIVQWRAANALEARKDPDALIAAYTLRQSPFNVMAAVVRAVAGVDAAIEAAALLHGQTGDDTLAEYITEHAGEPAKE